MEDLGEVLRALRPVVGDRAGVLVGLEEGDDAAVLDLDGETALVLTLDFFTPLVDDPYDWGRIACANALSDVYAMGGRPVAGLNIVGWPAGELPLDLLAEVLRGGATVAQEAGMAVVGGHTVDDPEPKYGLCVLGRVSRRELLTLSGAQPGDVLVLTKPVGTGVITTAIKREAAPAGSVAAAVASMTRLNAAASRAAVEAGARACTDVTGFGLLGHLQRMVRASGVGAEVDAAAVPLLPGARELAAAGHVPGGTRANRAALEAGTDFGGADETTQLLLCDAQTSGGLLVACPPASVERLLGALAPEPAAAVVGRVTGGPPGHVRVLA